MCLVKSIMKWLNSLFFPHEFRFFRISGNAATFIEDDLEFKPRLYLSFKVENFTYSTYLSGESLDLHVREVLK